MDSNSIFHQKLGAIYACMHASKHNCTIEPMSQWLSASLQYLQSIGIGDIAVMHQTIGLFSFKLCFYCKTGPWILNFPQNVSMIWSI